MISGTRYVPTEAAKAAASGHEAEIVRALGIAWNGSGKAISCPDPMHADQNPSWRLMDSGKAVCSCRQPHSVFDVVGYVKGVDFEQSKIIVAELLGRRDLIVDPDDQGSRRKIIASYPYRDSRGDIVYEAVRFSPKGFAQRRVDGGSWVWNLKGVRRLPYRLPQLIATPLDQRVYIPEGEKDVDRLRAIGLAATCNSEGAGKWRADLAEHFRGRDVVVLPDNDDAGRQHAQAVAANLAPVARRVCIIELPDLPPKGDVSDWLDAGGALDELNRLVDATASFGADADATRPMQPDAVADDAFDPREMTVAAWLSRDIAPPDFLLGEILSTTSRCALIAPTGLGKTNFTMAFSFAVADGAPFLHWRAGEGPRRVLFIDGEMSRRLMRRRLEDAVRRHGGIPDNFRVLNREQFPGLPPLNSEAGQCYIDRAIEAIGGVDLVIFDNIQSLLAGDMKDEEPWEQTLPWVRDLTRREIGQLWVHHTGHDETHGYGSKTREWQLDTVALLERVERPEADIAFRISFSKARERAPENRADFEPALIVLAGDEWTSERSASAGKPQARARVLALLVDAIAQHGEIPPANTSIPPHTPCVEEDLWRRCCERGCISEGSPDAAGRAFRRAAKALLANGLIGKSAPWVWAVR
jgi:AAA domain